MYINKCIKQKLVIFLVAVCREVVLCRGVARSLKGGLYYENVHKKILGHTHFCGPPHTIISFMEIVPHDVVSGWPLVCIIWSGGDKRRQAGAWKLKEGKPRMKWIMFTSLPLGVHLNLPAYASDVQMNSTGYYDPYPCVYVDVVNFLVIFGTSKS